MSTSGRGGMGFAFCREWWYTVSAIEDPRSPRAPDACEAAARTMRGPGDDEDDIVARQGVAAWRVFLLGAGSAALDVVLDDGLDNNAFPGLSRQDSKQGK
jgi:hypothetical protein